MRYHPNMRSDNETAKSPGLTLIRRSAAALLAAVALSIGASPAMANAAPSDDVGILAVVCHKLRPADDSYYQARCANPPLGTVRYFTRITCTDGRTYQGPAEIGTLGEFGRWSRASCPSGHSTVTRTVVTRT